jgi:hypothetical protein
VATLDTIQTFAVGNPALKQRFQAARLQVAWNVMTEAAGTTNHAARVVWAKKIFAGYSTDLDKEYLWFLSDSNIQTLGNSISDAQIVSGVAALVDSWA